MCCWDDWQNSKCIKMQDVSKAPRYAYSHSFFLFIYFIFYIIFIKWGSQPAAPHSNLFHISKAQIITPVRFEKRRNFHLTNGTTFPTVLWECIFLHKSVDDKQPFSFTQLISAAPLTNGPLSSARRQTGFSGTQTHLSSETRRKCHKSTSGVRTTTVRARHLHYKQEGKKLISYIMPTPPPPKIKKSLQESHSSPSSSFQPLFLFLMLIR